MNCPRRLILVLPLVLSMAPLGSAEVSPRDPALVLHYTFDDAHGETVTDHSGYGNHGSITSAEYLEAIDGRHGVLRFDGETSYVDCGADESIYFGGDMSFEMWIRRNGPAGRFAKIFGDSPQRSFSLEIAGFHSLVLRLRHDDPDHGWEQMVVPVDRNIFGPEWSHIAVVVEHPRCRFYHNGELVRDAYLPIPVIAQMGNLHKTLGGSARGAFCPMDLDEFRLYRRALGPQEIAAHARGKETTPGSGVELAVEPYWYEDKLALRLSAKGTIWADHRAELSLLRGDRSVAADPQQVDLTESSAGSGRHVGQATFPLSELAGQSLDAVARIRDSKGQVVQTAYQHTHLRKPDWVNSREGYSDDVLPPWTKVQADAEPSGDIGIEVWGRHYQFSLKSLATGIATQQSQLLAAPISLEGAEDAKPIRWQDHHLELVSRSDTAAVLQQTARTDSLSLQVDTTVEYDGYAIFECQLEARHDVTLDRLLLKIPLHTRYAQLCYGNRVLTAKKDVPISAWYSGAVRDDLAFRFSGFIWLGDDQRGLCWQSETDEFWHHQDEERAIEILPRDEVTTFQANFINVPTSLSAGQKLTYKFALQGTPIKPRQRTAWQWRIARHEPWGRIFELPDRETGGMPRLEYFRQAGIRHLFYRVADIWPYPLPVNEPFARQLQRAIDRIHASGLKLYPYLIHQRFPTVVPEFDLNGLHLAKRPTRWYVQASAPGIDHPRPGPLVIRYGSNSQGALLMCAKSMALQDAYVDSLARRLDQFGDDGVYLDGTAAIVPCTNLLHGCGHRTADGTIKPTHPAFGVRQFMKRIYTVVKQRRPHGIVDVHASFGQNFSALAYGDVLWTGEHWWHLRHEGAEHVATELPMDMFRTEFTGVPSGVAAETLSYRLGSRMQVAAISLLYDIPVRLNTRLDQDKDKRYFEHLTQLWKVRERFGAEDDVVERLLYYENQDYVTVSPEHCHATLLRHPENGVLAVVSNLQAEPQMVSVRFDLDRLQVRELNVRSYNALTDEYLEMDSTGQVRLSLDSLQWKYIWLRPRVCCGG